MRIKTAFSDDDVPTAVMRWSYPASHDFPSGTINAVLAGFYNQEDPLVGGNKDNHPFLYIVPDEHGQQVGLIITDAKGAELSPSDLQGLYERIIDENVPDVLPKFWPDPGSLFQAFSDPQQTMAAVVWRYPQGYVFPVDPLNAILAGLYGLGVKPFLYPVWDRVSEEDPLRQVGVIISETRDLPGTPSENWRLLRAEFKRIFNDDQLAPTDPPWSPKEWRIV